MAEAMMNIQIIPKVADLDDPYPTVDAAIAVVQSSGLPYEVGGLGTTVEGDFATLVEIAQRMNEVVIEQGAESVISQIRFYLGTEPITMDSLTSKFRD
jgi:uncharacterized protein YqgV (UPF0045/DUF77 family)